MRCKAGDQTLNLDTLGTLGRALGVFGLGGSDRLLGLRVAEVGTLIAINAFKAWSAPTREPLHAALLSALTAFERGHSAELLGATLRSVCGVYGSRFM